VERPPTPETIAAVATPPGRGGVGVIRVSGKDLPEFAKKLSGKTPPARRVVLAEFRDAADRVIDAGLLVYFPAPRSFTGEDVLELHAHGGPVVVRLLLDRCIELGARLADPGEFTRRAFMNGKIDLAQAEAVIDLIDASTEAAARSAARSLKGDFSAEIRALENQLIELRALVEATLDFPEEDVDFLSSIEAHTRLMRAREKLKSALGRARHGSRLQSGLSVVIAGQPNVGKSSLLNRLAGVDAAIVTPIAGTTRDTIRAAIEIEGIPLHVIDTAGLREAGEEIEKIGVARAWKEIEEADALVVLVDARTGIDAADRAILEKLPRTVPRVVVHNKADLAHRAPERREDDEGITIFLSAKRGDGVDLLRRELLEIAGGRPEEDVFIARARHVAALEDALAHLDAASEQEASPDLFAEELRLAHRALSTITGEFSSDELLGEIFGRFCIGK
jgi:tRNA modification GTPase